MVISTLATACRLWIEGLDASPMATVQRSANNLTYFSGKPDQSHVMELLAGAITVALESGHDVEEMLRDIQNDVFRIAGLQSEGGTTHDGESR